MVKHWLCTNEEGTVTYMPTRHNSTLNEALKSVLMRKPIFNLRKSEKMAVLYYSNDTYGVVPFNSLYAINKSVLGV